MRPDTRGPIAASLAAVLAVAGCGGGRDESNLSATSSADPARHARAGREMDDLARRNREAEARFHAGLGAPEHDAPGAHAGATSSP